MTRGAISLHAFFLGCDSDRIDLIFHPLARLDFPFYLFFSFFMGCLFFFSRNAKPLSLHRTLESRSYNKRNNVEAKAPFEQRRKPGREFHLRRARQSVFVYGVPGTDATRKLLQLLHALCLLWVCAAAEACVPAVPRRLAPRRPPRIFRGRFSRAGALWLHVQQVQGARRVRRRSCEARLHDAR